MKYAEPKILEKVYKYEGNLIGDENKDTVLGEDGKTVEILYGEFKEALKSEHYNEARRIKKLFKKAGLLKNN